MKNIRQKIAGNIAKIREQQGMTQLELGLALGYPEENAQSRISQYETGDRSPGKATLEKMASALHVPITDLIREEHALYNVVEQLPKTDHFTRHLLEIFKELNVESKKSVIKYAEERRMLERIKNKWEK